MKPHAGAGSCIRCRKGAYNVDYGSTSCSDCPAGFFCTVSMLLLFLLLVTSVSDSRLASFTISLGRNLAYDQLKKLNLGRIVNGSIYNKVGRFIKTKQI